MYKYEIQSLQESFFFYIIVHGGKWNGQMKCLRDEKRTGTVHKKKKKYEERIKKRSEHGEQWERNERETYSAMQCEWMCMIIKEKEIEWALQNSATESKRFGTQAPAKTSKW